MKLICHKGIPKSVFGILFVLSGTLAEAANLPADLFQEGEWLACRRESLRVHAADPENDRALFYYHAAGMHGNIRFEESMAGLNRLAVEASDSTVEGSASFHLGLDAWARGDTSNAWKHLSRAYRNYIRPDEHKLAGCMLYMMQWNEPGIVPESDSSLVTQLRTMRPLWTRERIDAALKYKESRKEQTAVTGKPGEWIVSFYRTQIGPAIGSRCSLHPSCSEYFLQASKQYGLKGIPLIGDRLIREPGVTGRAENPVMINGRERIADPVSDHVH